MDMPDLMNSQCLIWYRPCYFPQTFTRAVHRCVFSPLYDGLTDFPNSMDWQTWQIWLTCLIWWTKRHAWFDGQTDIPDLMDRWTCLIWWTHSAWFDTNLISLQHSPERYIDASFPPYMMDWPTSLIQWTDGHAWFDGLIDMPDLIDWRTYYPCCRHFRCCCCCCSGRYVVVVVAALDYNLICILRLGDFLHSHTYLLTNGLSVFN